MYSDDLVTYWFFSLGSYDVMYYFLNMTALVCIQFITVLFAFTACTVKPAITKYVFVSPCMLAYETKVLSIS